MDDKCACGCGHPIDKSVSDYYATEACQRRWNRRRAGLPVRDADESLDAFLATVRRTAAETRRRRQDTPTLSGTWREIGYTIGGTQIYTAAADSEPTTPRIEYNETPARWWSYYKPLHCWFLMECTAQGSRRLHAISDETARRAPAAVEDYLRRRFDGHIPPLPTRYID